MRSILYLSVLPLLVACRAVTPQASGDAVSQELEELLEQHWIGCSYTTREAFDAALERHQAGIERVRALVATGAVRSPEDMYHAAVLLEAGDQFDCLRAHVLASAAALEGHEEARWLAASSLDRYLHDMGQPQLFGTQFGQRSVQGELVGTIEPIDRLLPDELRARFDVRPLAESECAAEALQ